MKNLLILFLFASTTIGYSQTLKGIYIRQAIAGIGDQKELSEKAKEPSVYSYIYSNNISLQELISKGKTTIDTVYIEHLGKKYEQTHTLKKLSKTSYFKNYGENLFILNFTIAGNSTTIKDNIPTYNWSLQDGTKSIAGYSCKKATTTTTRLGRKQTITAWYCEDVPIQVGPIDYNGLPGLILQLEIGDLTKITFKKLQITPDQALHISEPENSAKPVSIKEYEEQYLSGSQ
ncbi:MAG: hypothetical protein CMC07_07280 [Flavobacteriaceae bacterium]|nr:hypothetical protein [Flavobacteriaceae bacterium]